MRIMLIINAFGDEYYKLIDFLFQFCNSIELVKYKDNYKKRNDRIMKYLKIEKVDFNIEYLKNNIEEISSKFRNYSFFDKDKYLKNIIGFEKYNEINRKIVIECAIEYYINSCLIKSFLKKNEKDIIKIKKKNEKFSPNEISYHFELSGNIKRILLNKNSIFDWKYPGNLQDLCFYKKNGLKLLNSISHEEICEICFQEGEEKEYEYLKSIGIKFVEKEFTPTPKEYLYYLEDDLKD